jgi:HEAT repeat protein
MLSALIVALLAALCVTALWAIRPFPNRSAELLDEVETLRLGTASDVTRLRELIGASPELWERATEDYAPVRQRAIQRAADEGIKECVPEVTAALSDNDSDVREQATQFFAALPTASARAALSELLREDRNGSVRAGAAVALSALADPSIVSDLLVASHDPDADVRMAAADGLASLGTAEALARLRAMLEKDSSEWVRASVALALAQKGAYRRALIAACRALAKSEHRNVRYMARGALCKCGAEVTPELLWELRNGDAETRPAAALELAGSQDKDILAQLRKMLSDRNELVRASAALALISSGAQDAEVERTAEACAKSDSEATRACGMEALRMLGRNSCGHVPSKSSGRTRPARSF